MAQSRTQRVLAEFDVLWRELFTTPVHLDSALSRRAKDVKPLLARTVPLLLIKPTALAQALGVGIREGEPWNLSPGELPEWRAARLIMERMVEQSGSIDRFAALEGAHDDFPPAMISEWRQEWGGEVDHQLTQALTRRAPLSLRATRSIGPERLLRELSFPGKRSLLSPLGVLLSEYQAVRGTDLFTSGKFEIQDEGSQVAAFFALWPELFSQVLSSRPGAAERESATPPELPADPPTWTIVDACAGAGGKTLALADGLSGKGRVYAYDPSEKKLQALRRRARGAGLTNVQAVPVVENKENEVVKKFRRRANRVMVDAPCSGWGVLRRNPDIKWRQSSDVLSRMPELQLRLLKVYSELVAPGGGLVFSVCTFRKAETTGVVERFLGESRDFEKGPGGYLGPDTSDGFFVQFMSRRS